MEDQSCDRPVPCKEEAVKPMLAVEIDILNSKIVDIREYLFQIQEITNTINTKINSISNLEGLTISDEKLNLIDNSKPINNPKPICTLQHLSNKIDELTQLSNIAQNIIERQSRIYKNISQIG